MYKLCRGIRVFASTYLQENLLTLPGLPTPQRLAEIRERKELEARERLQEIERQRQLQREQEGSLGPTHTSMKTTPTPEEEEEGEVAGASASDMAQGEKKKRFEKLKLFSTKVIPKVHFKREAGPGGVMEGNARVGRLGSGSGWMGTSRAYGSVDSQDDPFTLQRDQLQGFIQQARAAGRMDEVAALEQSLCEIENLISESAAPQTLQAYGFD